MSYSNADSINFADDDDDDDYYPEYNPHPYQGGYDIAATYGSPLPPSPSTCYPISIPIADDPYSPEPEPYESGSTETELYRPEPYYETPELFRSEQYLGFEQGGDGSEVSYWRQWMRGLDYLFGHSHGFGERRIGVDGFGIPVYASKKVTESAVEVEIEPMPVRRLEVYDNLPGWDNRSLLYDKGEEDSYAYSLPAYAGYESYPYEQSPSGHGSSGQDGWVQKPSYYQPVNPMDGSYYEAKSKYISNPIYSYNQHYYEQPLNIQVNPMEQLSSERLEFHENFASYNVWRSEQSYLLESSRHQYETQSYAPPSHAPALEPFKPSWSQNLGYYESFLEGGTPDSYSHSTAFGEQADVGTWFASPYYTEERHYYEQPNNNKLDSFSKTWHNLSNLEISVEDASQRSKWVDDSYNRNDSFWPFEHYSEDNDWQNYN